MSKQDDLRGCLALGGVFLSIFLVLGVVGKFLGTGEGEDKAEAWAVAQSFVKSRLKSPSSADFPWFNEASIRYLGKNSYRISSYVDAENSFGGTVRTNYTCTIKHEGGEWALVSISLR